MSSPATGGPGRETTPVATIPASGSLGRPIRVGVLHNPESGRNQRPRRARRFHELRAAHPEVLTFDTVRPEEIESAVRDLLRRETELIVANGGDGTVQAILTTLLRTPSLPSLPVLAVLPGGTTNMTSGDVGAGGRSPAVLDAILSAARQGRLPGPVERRPVIEVIHETSPGPLYGMFFSAGAIYHAVRFYHARLDPQGVLREVGPGATLAMFLTKVVLGQTGSLLPPLAMEAKIDGWKLGPATFVGMAVTTLRKLFFGLRPFWGEQPGDLRFSALRSSPRHVMRALLPIVRGKPSAVVTPANGYTSLDANEIELRLDSGFALDGELFDLPPSRTVRLRGGTHAFFARPPS